MGFIPKNAKWYLADLIEEFRVEDDPRNVVNINTILIRADSPDEAYARARELGNEMRRSYRNSQRKKVTVFFRGLRDLNVIHDKLEHGAELIYEERIGLSEEKVAAMVTPKRELGIFAPICPNRDGPNTMPQKIYKKLKEEGCDVSGWE